MINDYLTTEHGGLANAYVFDIQVNYFVNKWREFHVDRTISILYILPCFFYPEGYIGNAALNEISLVIPF
jgi:hypothetical protein